MNNLYQHQQEAIDRAIDNEGNLALFHSPGLGKTRSALEIYQALRITYHPTKPLKMLVVCPKSLINAAWREDVQKFTQLTFSTIEDKQINTDILCLNYEKLQSKKHLPRLAEWIQNNNVLCVLDESSRLKSHKSLTTKILLELAPEIRHRLILSGTPAPNSEVEFWAQMRFLNEDIVPKSFYAFRNIYFHLQRNGQLMNGKQYSSAALRDLFRQGWKYSITADKRTELMLSMNPHIHWVKKEDALDLPEKVDELRYVTLSAPEQKAYNEMRRHLITEIGSAEISVQVMLSKTMKLRQAVGGFMYGLAGETYHLGNSKLNELMDVLEELGDQPVIIWAQFHAEVKKIYGAISMKYGEESVRTLYSETEDKDGNIKAFMQGDIKYIIAHPKSAAHGLTFVNCSTEVFYALDWSYEAYTQAKDRIHRIGQDKKCLYIHLIAEQTIDLKIYEVLQQKATLEDALLGIYKFRKTSQGKSSTISKEGLPTSVGL